MREEGQRRRPLFVGPFRMAALVLRPAGHDCRQDRTVHEARRVALERVDAEFDDVRAAFGRRGDVTLRLLDALDEDGDAEEGHSLATRRVILREPKRPKDLGLTNRYRKARDPSLRSG